MFDWYPQYEYTFAQLQLVLFMLGMGATLTPRNFVQVLEQPRSLLAGATAQFLLTPILAVLVNRLADVEPGIAVGLVLVAAMPGGTLSKVFTYLGHGNLALSVSLTACGTLASIVTVPLLLRLLVSGYVPESFAVPTGWVVRDVALYLVLPLLVGLAVARWAAPYRQIFSRGCIGVGFVTVAVMVIGSLGSGRIHPGEYGWRAPLAIIGFCLVAQQVSMLPFRLCHWPRPDKLSVGIEVTMRNLNLALLLKSLLFPATEKGADPVADGVLFVILFYAAVAMCSGLPLALIFRFRARLAAQRAQAAAEQTVADPANV